MLEAYRTPSERIAIGAALYPLLAELALRGSGRWNGSGKWHARLLDQMNASIARQVETAFLSLYDGSDTRAVLRLSEILLEQHGGRLFAGYHSDAPADWRSPCIRSEPYLRSYRMADNKTKPTALNVPAFLHTCTDELRRNDAKALVKLMRKVTGKQPAMWGPSIVGFDSYHYKYESGREGDMPIVGFSPRKAANVLYGTLGVEGADALLAQLGNTPRARAASTSRSLRM